MPKAYSDRAMAHNDAEREFFFPKHDPRVTVKAQTREEAEAKLAALDNDKEV